MKLTMGGVIAAGAMLLFVVALGHITRGQAGGNLAQVGADVASGSTTVASVTGGPAQGAPSAAATPSPTVSAGGAQTGQPKTVDVGLRRRGHHEGHERYERE